MVESVRTIAWITVAERKLEQSGLKKELDTGYLVFDEVESRRTQEVKTIFGNSAT